ncbi:hypothetical protein L2E82_48790 [Cichorium intybus]|uniref:Uncharacterized protein n=1 Tax=Cichorium intybus TaxID=13427 RepID=A0ACB8YZ10_CICIN|nr:hypothetical protein L2E82_48790 [Cichorium intybus]
MLEVYEYMLCSVLKISKRKLEFIVCSRRDRVAILSGARFCVGHYPTWWNVVGGSCRDEEDDRVAIRRVAIGKEIGSRSRRVAIGSRSFGQHYVTRLSSDRVAIRVEIGSRSELFLPFSSFVLFFFTLRHMCCRVAIAVAG